MVDDSGQRGRSTLHVIKGIWDGVRGFLSDLVTPFDFQIDGSDYVCVSDVSNRASHISRNVNGYCTKWCRGCRQMRPVDEFLDAFFSQKEWTRCYYCRQRGDMGKLEGHYFNIKDRTGPHTKLHVLPPPHPSTFYEVELEERPNDLLAGETFVTWERLGCLKNKDRQERKALKYLRKRRRSKRRGKPIPWAYTHKPKSYYESKMRTEYEVLWRSGNDEKIPDTLLEAKSWWLFWSDFRRTDVYQDNIIKERAMARR